VFRFPKKKQPLLLGQKGFYSFLRELLPFPPRDLRLYETAFITRSGTITLEGIPLNNERLEFLGDSVISTIVAEHLYLLFPDKDEGTLTKLRSRLVNRRRLNEIALSLGLDRYVRYHHQSNNQQRHIYGDVFEAFIGALFLDQGYARTRKYFRKVLFEKYVSFQRLLEEDTDFKSLMIEWAQRNRTQLSYVTRTHTGEEGIRTFHTLLQNGNDLLGTGSGHSKKEAEQNASRDAYNRLQQDT